MAKDNKKVILLSDLYSAIIEWLNDRDNVEKQKALGILKQQINVIQYIGLQNKQDIVESILTIVNAQSQTMGDIIVMTEYHLMIDGLLAYTNIQNDLEPEIDKYEVYDVLMIANIFDEILKICKDDFSRLTYLVDRGIQFQGLVEIGDALGSLDLTQASQDAKEIEAMLGQLPNETIKDLADIARANVPGMQMLQDNIEKVVAQEVKDQK
jgi:hypothetical protein